jgi:riboflavin kinase/FMN adenylyltransferase
MRVARSLPEANGFGPSAVAVGNFDGVHAGHRRLLQATVQVARETGVRPTVLTFDPHPICVVAPERAPRLLTSLDERCALIAQQGVEQILVLPFTPQVARMTPEAFVTWVLRDGLRAKAAVVGENFRFGHKQSGDARTLIELGARSGFETRIVAAVRLRGRPVSASEVRSRIEAGQVALAARLLERPYALTGDIVHGHGIGSKQTVPTLNLSTQAEVLPKEGVYLTRTEDLDSQRRWNSITNIGHRPTFGGDIALSIETFLLDPFDGVTPARIRLEFLRRVRDERKFPDPSALKSQIRRDVGRAQAYFRRLGKWVR